jgi:calcium/calmodulin-dependent protein kinase I
MFQNEIDALRKLDHPNIIKLFEIYEDDTSFFLV